MATRGWNDVTAADVAKMGRKAATLPQVKTSGRSKYGAVKTVVDGVTFDSKAEARHYAALRLGVLGGLVHDLELQPEYEIRIADVLICRYRADFRFYDAAGELHVIDVKGVKTPVYRLKKKLVEAIHGIQITEVR